MAFRSFLTLSLVAGMAAAGPCYVSGTTTALASETTTATTSSFYSSETASASTTLTTLSSETTSTTATLSTESTETASTTATLSSSETESTSATITTFSSTESASTTASATTTSSVASDPNCPKHIRILRGQAIGGVGYYGDMATLEECLDACADAGNCIALAYMSISNQCYISYTGEEGNLWGPLDDDMYDSGYTNTC